MTSDKKNRTGQSSQEAESHRLVTRHLSLVTLLKLFRLEQRVEQVDQQQRRDQSANEVFGMHRFFSLPSDALAKAHIPERRGKEADDQHDENHV